MAPVLVCALAVALLLVADRLDHRGGRAAAKLVASTAFVWAAVVWGAAATAYGRWILLGLACCWAGDALLLSHGTSRAFQAGIGAFLLGHVSYAVACLQLGLDFSWLAAMAVCAAIFAGIVLRWLRPHVSRGFAVPVAAYVAAISVMSALAVGASLSGASWWLGLGALGFAGSDLSVARDRFIAPAFQNGLWGLPLYFGSQLVLARSVVEVVGPG